MATTDVPAFDGPIVVDVETIRATAREWLVGAQGDTDKATEAEYHWYYQGLVDGYSDVLSLMTKGEN